MKFEGIVKEAAMFQLSGMKHEEIVEMFADDEYFKSALIFYAQQEVEDVLEKMEASSGKRIQIELIKERLQKANHALKELLEG